MLNSIPRRVQSPCVYSIPSSTGIAVLKVTSSKGLHTQVYPVNSWDRNYPKNPADFYDGSVLFVKLRA